MRESSHQPFNGIKITDEKMLKKSYEYHKRVFKTHECPGLEGAMVQENFVLLA